MNNIIDFGRGRKSRSLEKLRQQNDMNLLQYNRAQTMAQQYNNRVPSPIRPSTPVRQQNYNQYIPKHQ